MGCDIHCCWETYRNGAWTSEDEWDEYGFPRDEILSKRNYYLFGLLAGVRRDNLEPISEPRGFPANMSPQGTTWASYVEHTPSWLTLDELLHCDLSRTATLSGLVYPRAYFDWAERGGERTGESPSGYCQGTSDRSISRKEMDALIERRRTALEDTHRFNSPYELRSALLAELGSAGDFGGPRGGPFEKTYVDLSWRTPYWYLAGELTTKAIPIMLAAAHRHGLSYAQVRIVFYFDN